MGRKEMNSKNPTLSIENYNIEMVDTGFAIFVTKTDTGEREWVATAGDPQIAMTIVEGLILVEYKRFYHPDTEPVFQSADEKPLPPFLKKGSEKS